MDILNCRIAYYGTRGKPGHFFRPLRGTFSEHETQSLSRVDSAAFHEATAGAGYCYTLWRKFLGYVIPFSVDDRRPGCVSAIFVEGAESSKDICRVINSDPELRWRFNKRLPKPNDFLDLIASNDQSPLH